MADEALTTRERWDAFVRGQKIYFQYVLGLIRPGEKIDVPKVHTLKPGQLDAWKPEELALMIDEGRRQSDRQMLDLERFRGRAQWLFTIGAAATAVAAGVYGDHGSGVTLLAIVLLAYGVGGAAAVRADFNTIDTAVLSKVE